MDEGRIKARKQEKKRKHMKREEKDEKKKNKNKKNEKKRTRIRTRKKKQDRESSRSIIRSRKRLLVTKNSTFCRSLKVQVTDKGKIRQRCGAGAQVTRAKYGGQKG